MRTIPDATVCPILASSAVAPIYCGSTAGTLHQGRITHHICLSDFCLLRVTTYNVHHECLLEDEHVGKYCAGTLLNEISKFRHVREIAYSTLRWVPL